MCVYITNHIYNKIYYLYLQRHDSIDLCKKIIQKIQPKKGQIEQLHISHPLPKSLSKSQKGNPTRLSGCINPDPFLLQTTGPGP